jgi:dTDP-4-amino-4,6-dideoxygalactose transaminase
MLEELAKLGIFAGIHYRKPVHMHPAFSSFANNSNTSLRYTEELSNTILSLPMYPGLTDDEVNRVVEGVINVR